MVLTDTLMQVLSLLFVGGSTSLVTWLFTVRYKRQTERSKSAELEYKTSEDIAVRYIQRIDEMTAIIDHLHKELMNTKITLQKALSDMEAKERVIQKLKTEIQELISSQKK